MGPSTAILWPVLVQVTLIHLVYFLLYARRRAAVATGRVRLSQLRDNVVEPEETRFLRNNLTNQFELPVLFVAGCIALYATGHAGAVPVLLAWLFVASRLLHAYIHLSRHHHMRYRVPAFIVGYALNGMLWLWLAANIAIV